MQTILVGDIHLKSRIMLPMVEKAVNEHGAKQIILMGDYLDDYDCEHNPQLYLDELNYLIGWKKKMESADIKVIPLLGNHDAPYLTGELKNYSLHENFYMLPNNQDISEVISQKLIELGIQISFQLDDFLVSHAGYIRGSKPKRWHHRKLTLDEKDIRWVSEIASQEGSRGGLGPTGSVIWADFSDLIKLPSIDVTNQIVAHTPQSKIIFEYEREVHYQLVDIDTFSLKPIEEYPYVEYIGNGELLLYNNGELSAIGTDWRNKDILENLYQQRQQD